MTLTELSIKRPSLIIVIFSALIILGLASFQFLQYELLPKFSAPIITITTAYPGASPQEVETNITKPVEDAISGLDKISVVSSSSFEGISFVIIELLQSANTDISIQDAQRKVAEITSKLPTGSKSPVISKIALDEIPVIRLGASSNLPNKEFYQLVKDRIKPRLSKLAGIGQIALVGGEEREIKINLDIEKLRSYGLSVSGITSIIKASNLDFPTGKVKDADGQFIVRLSGKFESVEQLRNLAIGKSRAGGEVRLADVAEVTDGIKERETISRINGFATVGINVQKQTDANAVDVAKEIKKELKAIEKDYAAYGFKYVIAQDASIFTIEAADAVKEDLLIAVFLVAIVMLLFLHSLRNSVIVLVAIPSSLISTFIGIYAFNYTLNLMTLLGLSLVVGILVDDSIVVLENIYHHLEKGAKRRDAALTGRNEIGFAALAITLVDVAVFLPLALVGGIIGNIMKQFAMVIVISTMLSLFVSFTVTPLLASRFAKLERLSGKTLLGKFALWFEDQFNKFTATYMKVLNWALRHKVKVTLIVIASFMFSIALFPLGFIGAEFISVADRGEFAVTLELPQGIKFDDLNLKTLEAERVINAMPEVKQTYVNVGTSSEGLLGFSSSNNSEINVTLVPTKERNLSTDEVMALLRRKLTVMPGAKVRVNPIGIFGVANQTPIQIVITGPDFATATKYAKVFADAMKSIPGTGDIRLSAEEGKPETRVEIDRSKLNSFGLTIAEVGQAMSVALAGDADSKFRDGNNEYDIRIQLDEANRNKTTDLGKLTFVNRTGQIVELQQFATVTRALGPTKLSRRDRVSAVTVYSQAVGRPSGSIAQDLQKAFSKIQLPPDVNYVFTGDIKNQAESFGSLLLVFGAAILFTYMIMVALYDSFIYPFVVLFSVPLAIIGAFLALALTMKALSIFSILGLIMLVGLVGKNAILLVDRANFKIAEGESVREALLDAGKMRLRPILMTTFTMIFGMLPIALSKSSGSEWKSGLAFALIGGLTSSLFLTLIVVPVVYEKIEEIRVRLTNAYYRRFKKSIFEDDAAIVDETAPAAESEEVAE